MTDHERSTTVAVPPAVLFDYLSDLQHLPAYLPRLTGVRATGDGTYEVTAHIEPPDSPPRDVEGEAWMKVKEAGRTLQWGSAGPSHYHGELDVDPGEDSSSSTLTVRLSTERSGPGIENGLDETLNGIKARVESAEQSV